MVRFSRLQSSFQSGPFSITSPTPRCLAGLRVLVLLLVLVVKVDLRPRRCPLRVTLISRSSSSNLFCFYERSKFIITIATTVAAFACSARSRRTCRHLCLSAVFRFAPPVAAAHSPYDTLSRLESHQVPDDDFFSLRVNTKRLSSALHAACAALHPISSFLVRHQSHSSGVGEA